MILIPLLELLIPDSHLELFDKRDEIQWSFSWPLVFGLFMVPFKVKGKKTRRDSENGFSVALQLEPQYRYYNGEMRYLGSLRAMVFYHLVAGMLEGGGVISEDGNGGFFGVGLGASFGGWFYLGANYRRFFTGGVSDRNDLSIDLMLPIPLFMLFNSTTILQVFCL